MWYNWLMKKGYLVPGVAGLVIGLVLGYGLALYAPSLSAALSGSGKLFDSHPAVVQWKKDVAISFHRHQSGASHAVCYANPGWGQWWNRSSGKWYCDVSPCGQTGYWYKGTSPTIYGFEPDQKDKGTYVFDCARKR